MDQNPQINEGQIEVDVCLTLSDFLWANYWFLFKRFRRFIIILFVAGVVYPILYLTGASGELKPAGGNVNLVFFIPGALLLLLLLTTFRGSRRSLRANKALQGQIHYCFSREGISTVGPLSSGQVQWGAIKDAFETGHNFLIFLSNNLMYLIPKRCFQSSGDLSRFRQLLAETLGQTARLRKK